MICLTSFGQTNDAIRDYLFSSSVAERTDRLLIVVSEEVCQHNDRTCLPLLNALYTFIILCLILKPLKIEQFRDSFVESLFRAFTRVHVLIEIDLDVLLVFLLTYTVVQSDALKLRQLFGPDFSVFSNRLLVIIKQENSYTQNLSLSLFINFFDDKHDFFVGRINEKKFTVFWKEWLPNSPKSTHAKILGLFRNLFASETGLRETIFSLSEFQSFLFQKIEQSSEKCDIILFDFLGALLFRNDDFVNNFLVRNTFIFETLLLKVEYTKSENSLVKLCKILGKIIEVGQILSEQNGNQTNPFLEILLVDNRLDEAFSFLSQHVSNSVHEHFINCIISQIPEQYLEINKNE